MSLTFPNLVLPACVGWNFAKRRKFSTTLQTPKSKRNPASATLQTGVIFELELTYEFLKNAGLTYSDDMEFLGSFYEACRGGYGWFTFDPSVLNLDTMAVVQGVTALRNGFFGVGDGVTTTFPLWRSTSALGGGTVTQVELIQNVTVLGGIYSNGSLVSGSLYTQSNLNAHAGATVAFTTAPASGAVLSWAGNYSYLCRFAEDLLDAEEFMYQLWELKSLKLETVNL